MTDLLHTVPRAGSGIADYWYVLSDTDAVRIHWPDSARAPVFLGRTSRRRDGVRALVGRDWHPAPFPSAEAARVFVDARLEAERKD